MKLNQIAANSISLIDDLYFSKPQRAVQVDNCMKTAVVSNTLSGPGWGSGHVSLVLDDFTPAGNISCNSLSQSGTGFDFINANSGTFWKGNTMDDHQRGMALRNFGVIGAQGTPTSASDNRWITPANWTGARSSLYCDASSDAANSKLFIKQTSDFVPQNITSANFPFSYTVFGNISPATGTYVCNYSEVSGGWDSYPKNFGVPYSEDYDSEGGVFAAQMTLYKYLRENLDVLDSVAELAAFYNEGMPGTNVETLADAQELLLSGDIINGCDLIENMIADHNVDQTCKSFYELYCTFANKEWTINDSTDLRSLAELCYSEDGPCVQQAKALYAALYDGLYVVSVCDASEARKKAPTNEEPKHFKSQSPISLQPNPSTGEFIISGLISERIIVHISDLSGRQIREYVIVPHEGNGAIRVDTESGMYVVTIIDDESILIEKVVIQK